MTAKELLIRELEEALEQWDEECEETRNKGAATINELKRLINLTEAGELKTVIHALTHENNPVWYQFNEREQRADMYTHAQTIEFAVEAMEQEGTPKLVAVAHGSDETEGDSGFGVWEEWMVEYTEGETLTGLRPKFRNSLIAARPDDAVDEIEEEIADITGFWVLTTEQYQQIHEISDAYFRGCTGGSDSNDYSVNFTCKEMAKQFHLARGEKDVETAE